MAGRKLQISIVGAGSVGTTLAVALSRRGHSIVSVISRNKSSARRCARLVRCRNYSTHLLSLPFKSDFILIAVPDDSIATVASELSRLNIDHEGTYIAHTSGVLSSEVLRQVSKRGASVFSFHPMQTFSRFSPIETRLQSIEGIRYGFEGDKGSKRFASGIASDLKGRLLPIPKEAKILYHLACVFASNYSVALFGAVEMLSQSFSGKAKLRSFRALIQSSIVNSILMGPAKALTGPVARGNVETVRLHLRELKRRQKSLVPLYRKLGLLALELAVREKTLPPQQMKQLKRVLTFN
ncbi:MAG: hypothetical protein HW374_265 [Bacteroidetes bacterium]|nr:hypothetical protein [Bacteroidota bacterium]